MPKWTALSLALAVVIGCTTIYLSGHKGSDNRQRAQPAPEEIRVLSRGDARATVAESVGGHRKSFEKSTPGDSLFPQNRQLAEIQLSRTTFHKNFVFPGGSLVTINFDTSNRSIDDADLGVSETDESYVEKLKELARRGVPGSALQLHERLEYCKSMPRSETTLAEAFAVVEHPTASPPSAAPVETSKERLTENFLKCRAADDELYERMPEYLQISADSGDMRSAVLYAMSRQNTEPTIAIEYYRRALDAGEISGAMGLARVYRSIERSTLEDDIKAYGYYYAAFAVKTALYDGLPGQNAMFNLERLHSDLREFEAQVSPAAIGEGRALAKRLIEQKERFRAFN